MRYYSQDVETCGARLDLACGAVSLANAMLLLGSKTPTPQEVITRGTELKSFDMCGLSPSSLRDLCIFMCGPMGYTVELVHNCQLAPGMLMYVRSVALLNAQGGVQFEESEHDSHIVLVEAISDDGTVVVINPDRRRNGNGFVSDMWGRMKISPAALGSVWQSARADGTYTVRTAISIIRILSRGAAEADVDKLTVAPKNSKRQKRFEVAPPVPRGRRKRQSTHVVQALTEEVWTLCLEFSIDKVQTWSSMQLVSKEFHLCLRKARALSHFLFRLYRVESLERLGVSATGIRRLKLSSYKITDANLQALSSLVALETLDLGGCCRIIDLQALAPLVVLKTLNLAGCTSIIGLQALAPLVALETLNLDFCDKITDADLKALTPLVALKTLNLCYCDKITDVGLQALARLVALQALNLAGCRQITDGDLEELAPLLVLKKLNLSCCDNITDAGLQALAPLQALQALDLDYCNEISDRGLRLALAPLKALQMLNIRGCTKITDRLHFNEARLSWRYERWFWETHEGAGRFS